MEHIQNRLAMPAMTVRPSFIESLGYILLSFPLSIFFFVYIVAGLSVGVGTLPILIGIPVLVGIVSFAQTLVRFELKLIHALLKMEVPRPAPSTNVLMSPRQMILAELRDGKSWLCAVYLGSKLIISTVSFTTVVTLLSVAVSLIVSPIVYVVILETLQINIFELNGLFDWQVSSGVQALACSAVGMVMLPLFLVLSRSIAEMNARIAIALMKD